MPDTYLFQTPDPQDPTRTISTPVTLSPEALERIRETDPDLAVHLISPTPEHLQELAREQDIAARQAVVREMPIFGRLASFGVGLANELTLGLPAALMDDEERRTFEATQREFGGTMAAGQGLGIVAPALLTGGATLEAAGLRTLLPGGLAQAAGNSAEQALLRSLVARGVNPRVARGLSIAGGAAVDGGISGAQAAVTQANIEGTPLDAESILASVGLGAGLGLGVGGLLGAGSALRRGATGQLAQQGAAGLGPAAVEVLEDGTLRVIPRTPEQAQGLMADVVSSRAVRVATGLGDSAEAEIRELMVPGAMADARAQNPYTAFARTVSDNTGDALNRTRELIDQMRSAETRQAAFGALGEGVELGPVQGAVRGFMAGIDEVLARGAQRLPQAAVRRARLVRGLLENVALAYDVPEIARRLDNLIDRTRVDGLSEGWADPDLAGAIARALGDTTGAGRSGVEALLEGLGPQGARAVAAHRAVRDFDLAVRDLKGAALRHNVSLDELRLNPGRLFQSVSDSGFRVPTLDLTDDFHRMNSVAHKAAQVAADQFGLDRATVEAVQESLRQSSSDLVRAKEWGRRIAILRNLQAQEAQGAGLLAAGGIGGVGAGATVGAVLGGGLPGAAIGALAGFALTAGTHPISMLTRWASLSSAKAGVQARLTQEVAGLRRSLERGRRFRAVQRGARQIPRLVVNLKSKERRREEYETITGQITQLASNPQMMVSVLEDAVGGVAETSPELANYMSAAYLRGVQYLAANIPPSDQPGLFNHLMDLEPSQAEIDAFVRRFEAIEDPLSIVRMAAEFSLTPDHVQAVRSVYPELYTAIQAEITAMVGDLVELPPYSARIQLSTLLDVPADPSYDARFIQRMQQRYAQTAQQQLDIQPQARRTTRGASRVAGNTYSESTSLSVRLSQDR